jgi:atypical dual specificity phosphatase
MTRPFGTCTTDALAELHPRAATSAYFGPGGFAWMVEGRLAGAARPGLFHETALDLEALRRVGIDVVYSLTAEWVPDAREFGAAGLVVHHVPIPDRAPPTDAQGLTVCAAVAEDMRAGRSVAFHCHAGRGRTGTLLAAQWVWRGVEAGEAIARTRRANPRWIESAEQEDWLHRFEAVLRDRATP